MTSTNDPEKFKARWNDRVEDFARLLYTLPPEEHKRLQEARDELYELVEIAAEEREEDNES